MILKDIIPAMEEEDPWKGYDPDAQESEPVTQEEVEKAVEEMKKPRKRPPYLSYVTLVGVFLWCLGHLAALYMMIGSPVAGGIFLIVVVNLLFLGHYTVLLVMNIGRHRNEQR